jgi:hypothetical protein
LGLSVDLLHQALVLQVNLLRAVGTTFDRVFNNRLPFELLRPGGTWTPRCVLRMLIGSERRRQAYEATGDRDRLKGKAKSAEACPSVQPITHIDASLFW